MESVKSQFCGFSGTANAANALPRLPPGAVSALPPPVTPSLCHPYAAPGASRATGWKKLNIKQ